MKAILDTNVVIYLQKGLLATNLPRGEYCISIITEMELLSFAGLDESQRAWLHRFIAELEVRGFQNLKPPKVVVDLASHYQ